MLSLICATIHASSPSLLAANALGGVECSFAGNLFRDNALVAQVDALL